MLLQTPALKETQQGKLGLVKIFALSIFAYYFQNYSSFLCFQVHFGGVRGTLSLLELFKRALHLFLQSLIFFFDEIVLKKKYED